MKESSTVGSLGNRRAMSCWRPVLVLLFLLVVFGGSAQPNVVAAAASAFVVSSPPPPRTTRNSNNQGHGSSPPRRHTRMTESGFVATASTGCCHHHHRRHERVMVRLYFQKEEETKSRDHYGDTGAFAVHDEEVAAATTKQNDNNNNNNNDDVRRPLVLLLLSQFILFLGVGAVIPSIPLYGQEIGLTGAVNGVVISAPAVTLLLLSKQSGIVADQARKPALMVGMAAIAVADLGTACANGFATLLVARLALGAGRSLSEAGERGLLSDLAGRVPEWRGRALAAQQAVLALGIAIGAPCGGALVEQYGPRAAFLCVSAAALVALFLYSFLPETVVVTTTNTTWSGAASSVEKQEDDNANNNKESAPVSRFALPSWSSMFNDQKKKMKGAAADGDGDAITPPNGRDDDNTAVVAWSSLLRDNDLWKGLALCQCGVSFGLAAKIAIIPIIATNILPGGALGAGALLSAAGLSGFIGAPLGGYLTDRAGAMAAAVLAGVTSGIALLLIPIALTPALLTTASDLSGTVATTLTSWMPENPLVVAAAALNDDHRVVDGSSLLDASPQHIIPVIHTSLGDLDGAAAAFCGLVILWSTAVSAQSPALTALAQEAAPAGSVATSLALPKAAGDGTYIVAPFLLGLVADFATTNVVPGLECAVAGGAALLGAVALGLLGKSSSTASSNTVDGR